MTDRISLTGLVVRGFHGVFESERRDGQDFVDRRRCSRWTPVPPPPPTTWRCTVDYGGLATDLAEVVGGEPVDLIETLAARLADVCLSRRACAAATVTVHKPSAPIPLPFADVAVTVRPGSVREPAPCCRSGRTWVTGRPRSASPSTPAALAGRRVAGVRDAAVGAGSTGRLPQRRAAGARSGRRRRRTGWPARTPPSSPRAAPATSGGGRGRSTWTWSPSTTWPATIPALTLPHPRAAERAFVLVPWLRGRSGRPAGRPTRSPTWSGRCPPTRSRPSGCARM